ncbi:MAG: aminotransferase class I/II-fold pyridoxal phosphate-dependent enzyme [Deltaproteobacteria bacterium]|nr:aminotransferase class I/II-fold pyridoxal phosphate-dependent enzyme [Deltaproteobacteria bacterium]
MTQIGAFDPALLTGPHMRAEGVVTLARDLQCAGLFFWLSPRRRVRLGTASEVEVGGTRLPVPDLSATRVTVDGGQREYVAFDSADYLGASVSPRLVEAAMNALLDAGAGTGGSRLVCGTTASHEQLEVAIAEYEHADASLFFGAGYDANVAVGMMHGGAPVLADELLHASAIDGCRAGRAAVEVFRHNDAEDLEERLHEAERCGRPSVWVESVYSMSGDEVAPRVLRVAQRHGASIIVDAAHSTLAGEGPGGWQVDGVDRTGITVVGTTSKAAGAAGGYVAGSRGCVAAYMLAARPFWFSTSPPASTCAAAHAALRLMSGPDGDVRRRRLRTNAARVRDELREMGYDIGSSTTYIIPVILGDTATTLRATALLRARGILAGGVLAPAVPRGQERIRLCVSSEHTAGEIDQLLDAFRDSRDALLGPHCADRRES